MGELGTTQGSQKTPPSYTSAHASTKSATALFTHTETTSSSLLLMYPMPQQTGPLRSRHSDRDRVFGGINVIMNRNDAAAHQTARKHAHTEN